MNAKFGMAALAAAVVVAGGLWFALAPKPQQSTQLLPFGAVGAQTTAETTREVFEVVMGNPEAKVTLIEYASYTCPHCATFHANVLKPLKADYIDTGKIQFIYREVFFDRYGLWAAMIARCGGEMRYPGISALLYETQGEWAGAGEAPQVIEALRRVGLRAGFTVDELDVCLQDGELAQAMVAKFQRDAEEHGINSTPSLVLNGTKHGNMSYDSLRALIDAELAK
jgi:protein-disulfide isomerase